MDKVLVTGSAGFIGYHVVRALLSAGKTVVGVDNLNDYYDQSLKRARLNELKIFLKQSNKEKLYDFFEIDISDALSLKNLFRNNKFNTVINLAAQAGVRYSLENPQTYIKSNLDGFANILECCRSYDIKHLLYASSSSVYGMNKKQPFSTFDNTDFPISLYAATKKSNELLAHSYSHLYGLPCTGLRFFTVYGPYGRPDMAYFKFTKAVLNGESIDVFNNGEMQRDFTYIDDIVEGIMRIMDVLPKPQENKITNSCAPFKVYNLGNNEPVTLDRFINAIEIASGHKAKKNLLPMQPGDVPITFADIDDLAEKIKFAPSTTIEEGILKFVNWYKKYYETR